jgi:hypothetical protein
MNKVVLICLLIALAYCQIQRPNYLSLSSMELINSRWKFYNDDGFLGDIKFTSNGTIAVYDSPNERTWILND